MKPYKTHSLWSGNRKIPVVCMISIMLISMHAHAEEEAVLSPGLPEEEEAALTLDSQTGDDAYVIPGLQAEETEDIPDSSGDEQISRILSDMTLQDKVAQLFVISPEALTGESGVTAAGEDTMTAFLHYPAGGIIYMEPNLQTLEQTREMLGAIQSFSLSRIGLPVFLCVDEEGGSVSRISGRIEQVPYIPDMASVGSSQNPLEAYQTGRTIGWYLNRIGFNVDFAPVADVLTNPDNTVIGSRSFGSDPKMVADMVALEVQGLNEQGVCATLKHFPGHGGTGGDSHQELAVSERTLEELRESEFLPFRSGIDAGAEFVMAGHIALPNITGDDTPASLSHRMLTEILRGELGFQGIIITDALNMGAVTSLYGPGEAAVQAFLAGADLLLMPADFELAYSCILNEVGIGRISEERLDESLRRILRLKLRMMHAASEEAASETEGIFQTEDLSRDLSDPGSELPELIQPGLIEEAQ